MMEFTKTISEAGYDLKTPQCVTFDLADVEAWYYLGVTEKAADWLVRGFPAFWEESGQAEILSREPSALADAHRPKAIKKLAAKNVLPTSNADFCPIRELSYQRQRIADGFYAYPEEWPGGDIFKGTPLEEMVARGDQKIRDTCRTPLLVTLDEWQHVTRQLFDMLVKQSDIQLKPGALRVTEKQRLQRDGEMPRSRGAKLVPFADLEQFYPNNCTGQIQWGSLWYDAELVDDSHFFVVGYSRTGKTVLLRLLFQSIYRKHSSNTRFVFYDAKADLIPNLYPPEFFDAPRTQEEIDSQLYVLNPIDDRCTGWDIARDAAEVGDAIEIAEILFPEVTSKDEFFAATIREISVAVMDALTRKAGGPHWDFYDFLCAMRHENLHSVLSTTQRGLNAYNGYLSGSAPSSQDIYKSIATKTNYLLPVAFEWRKAKQSISLRNWVNNDTKSIVLMGNDRYESAVKAINRVLLSMICKNSFAQDKKKSICRTYMYLDEFEQLGRIDSIIKAGQQGASKFITIAMCLHDIDLFRKVYGNESEGLLAMCGFSAFLKMNGAVTAEWASRLLGRQEILQKERVTHFKEGGTPTGDYSVSERMKQTSIVLPEEIQNLPFPKESRQITGYFISPTHPRYLGELPFTDLLAKPVEEELPQGALWPAAKQVEEFRGPDNSLSSPEDTFLTLYELGFYKTGYEPPQKEPETVMPDNHDTDSQSESDTSPQVYKKLIIKDMKFNFGLED